MAAHISASSTAFYCSVVANNKWLRGLLTHNGDCDQGASDDGHNARAINFVA
jgi:hypothetical protein